MSWVMVGAGVVSLGSSAFSYFKGRNQERRGQQQRENAVNPGFQPNAALIDRARILGERYGNYRLPEYNNIRGNIEQSAAQGMAAGVQGATSGGDVMDLAARIAYGQTQALNDLEARQGAGRDTALMQYLDADVMAGAENQRINEYDRMMYQQQLQEAAALEQAGLTNQYTGIDSASNAVSSTIMAKAAQGWDNRNRPNITGTSMASVTPGQSPTTVNPYRINPQSGMNSSAQIADEYRKMLRESLLSKSYSVSPYIAR